jgi:hypothetical protein
LKEGRKMCREASVDTEGRKTFREVPVGLKEGRFGGTRT